MAQEMPTRPAFWDKVLTGGADCCSVCGASLMDCWRNQTGKDHAKLEAEYAQALVEGRA